MPIRVFNTFGVSTVNHVVIAATGDTIVVTRTGGLAYDGIGDFAGVFSAATFARMVIHGEVYGSFGILDTSRSSKIFVGADGLVMGNIDGIATSGGMIENHGTIIGTYGVNSVGNVATTLTNSGTIATLGGTIAVYLSEGNDVFNNAGLVTGSVLMSGGDDIYNGEGGRVTGTILMGAGSDSAEGGAFRERFMAGSFDGNDFFYGGGGIDTYDASQEAGNGLRADLLRGTVTFAATGAIDVVSGIENVRAGAGRDTILGGRDNNSLWGGAGNDALNGRSGNDLLYGETGNDLLDGSTGDDTLVGGFGDDRMSAGDGDDLLISDGGRDTLTGGAGIDTFVFTGPLDRARGTYVADRITDFQVGQDQIDLTSLDANLAIAGNQAFAWVGAGAVTAAGQAGYTTAAGVTRLWVYVDDMLPPQRQPIIELTGTIVLTASDLLL